ncbi:hypothetical protein HOD30_04155 [Candidatus Peregrinibacteria bacterium]|nr:hypothetical protein [Candidatus Peregrinibacteria bacterium]MBT4632153.1 hypothetical protein [Candidatus Peregrinibacteria bacterium]MBT5517076.1 hypothetical protein [Candidatus Peregrinibacteria bacterium]MBT5824071.1 hypothetical protein [Candidatus Peregrinibacteria bacterium]
MTKNLKIFWQLFRINIKKSLVYRVNFAVTVLSISLWIVLYILFFEVIFSHIDSLAGWSKGEALVVLGFYYMIQGVSNIFFRESFENFDYKLRRGDLDPLITKPASMQLLSFFVDMRIDHVIDFLITFIIFGYVHFQIGMELSWPLIALGTLLSIISNILFYGLLLCIINVVFLFDRIEVIGSTLWNISQISRYPRQVYTGAAKVAVQFVFPAALLAAIPAEVALGKSSLYWVGFFTFLAFFFWGLGTLLFNLGLRKYSSAN